MDLFGGQNLAVHDSALDDKERVFLCEIANRLGGINWIAINECNCAWTSKHVVNSFNTGVLRADLGKGVLDDRIRVTCTKCTTQLL